MDQEQRSFYTVAEVAEMLQVSDRTVRNMIERGTLEATKIDPSATKSSYRIDRLSFESFLSRRNE